jgi:putative phosphonate metabolism protein
MTARYAIYFSPAQHSPWWELGSHWLGRDECADAPLAQCLPTQFEPAELFAVTSEPRRYGFHATLKAPFCLSGGHSADDLMARLQALAVTLKPVALGSLQVVTLGDFVALMPATAPDELAALAAACVTGLDDLRAPLSQADLTRRRATQLDEREQELLQLYGYPYVLERFRFHLTLSGPVQPAIAQRVMQAVAEPVAQLNLAAPLVLDRLCLFVEPAPGQPFKRIADMEMPS